VDGEGVVVQVHRHRHLRPVAAHARIEPASGYTCVLACDGYAPRPMLLALD
jgi:hypothetical protein